MDVVPILAMIPRPVYQITMEDMVAKGHMKGLIFPCQR